MVKPDITVWQPIPSLYEQGYERYLPTAFDGSMTILEKMNKIIHYLNSIGALLDSIGEQWNKIVEWVLGEGLENAVRDILTEWLNDGTLANIMSQLIDALPFINLKQYITANGVSQTVGFQECLDVAKLLGGVKIIIPSGYAVVTTAELNAYKNTTIEMNEGASVKRNHNGYMLLNGLRGGNYNGYSGNGNIKLIGGVWDANGYNKPATASALAFAHATNLVFRDVTIKDSNSHHIEMNSSQNVRFENVRCVGLSTTAENATAEAIQLDFAGSAGFPAFGTYDATFCKDVVFRDCYFGESGSTGTTGVARGIGTHSARMGRWHDDITIDNCTFENLLDYGIQCYNYRNVKIKNNTFRNLEGGIILYVAYKDTDYFDADGNPAPAQDSDNFRISNNKFTQIKTKNHIRVYGTTLAKIKNTKIHNNTIENATGTAPPIYALYFDDLEATNNTIQDVKRYGMSIGNGYGFKGIGNTITNSLGTGIIIGAGVSDVTLAHNEITEVDFHGILLTDGVSDFVLTGNRTKNVNRANGGYNHIHIVSGCKDGTITGNRTKNGTYSAEYSLYVTNTCTDIVRTGNVWKGGGSIRSVYDVGITTAGVDIA